MSKSVILRARFTPEEAAAVERTVEAVGGNVSEFIRTCVNRELAITGDPEGMKALFGMFDRGIAELVKRGAAERVVRDLRKVVRERKKAK